MKNILIEQLTNLQIRKNTLKRYLDIKYYDKNKRHIYFDEIKEIDKEIAKIKFKLNLERKLKNE